LQDLLTRFTPARHVTHTRHIYDETLFWCKAASVLGRPQVQLLNSEVPIPPNRARSDLVTLLRENLGAFEDPGSDDRLIFDGWRQLCEAFGPVFLEKSPHHLHQWSALELMLECAERFDAIEFLFVGLIRNPMDTLYSAWMRWRTPPELAQIHWARAYTNLLRLEEETGASVVRVRYEHMIESLDEVRPIFEFTGLKEEPRQEVLHGRSVSRWKRDRFYGFELSPEVAEVAARFGYTREELENRSLPGWHAYRDVARIARRAARGLRRALS